MKYNHKSGFTLIELMVVISIVTFIASLLLVSIKDARLKARDARRLSDMHQIQNALELYAQDFGNYPSSNAYIYEVGTNMGYGGV